MKTNIAIIGGGLAGLRLASLLQAMKADFQLIEARERFGGRILSTEDHGLDQGPAWFWPGQPRMERLLNDLGLAWFEQYSSGKLVFQDETGAVRRDIDFSTMAGSRRVAGGLSRLVEALTETLDPSRLHRGWPAARIEKIEQGLTIVRDDGDRIEAERIVIALPPRLAEARIVFAPELDRGQRDAMRRIPTWMAGHAKILALYDRPFWRDRGLSGDGISHRGPMMEIHDASPADGGAGALFGFVGVPAGIRSTKAEHLPPAAVEQLTLMFGEEAARPREVILTDWAFERFTATEDDFSPPQGHPSYGTPPILHNIWKGRLLLASTETAPTFGGFLEGALEAAEGAIDALSL
ncbi:MAG: FAD-dependent oxidoreductase [Alphaproteobacteria bacterium]|nr:FAD-dependent oxidoreductase [Alphaproteobacteria bacterium]